VARNRVAAGVLTLEEVEKICKNLPVYRMCSVCQVQYWKVKGSKDDWEVRLYTSYHFKTRQGDGLLDFLGKDGQKLKVRDIKK